VGLQVGREPEGGGRSGSRVVVGSRFRATFAGGVTATWGSTLARWRSIVCPRIVFGAIGDLEAAFQGDGAVDEGMFGGAADWAFIHPEDAKGLAPVELGLALPVAARVGGARVGGGSLVRLGGAGGGVYLCVIWIGSRLELAVAPMVAGVKNACEPAHESGLGNCVQLPQGVVQYAHAMVDFCKDIMVGATADARDDLEFDGQGRQYEAAFE
jgi:hypothetical protein